MPIVVEGMEVKRGDSLLWPYKAPARIIYKDGTVVDINEHVKAVKLNFAHGKSVVNEWFAAASLRRTQPKEEAKETK